MRFENLLGNGRSNGRFNVLGLVPLILFIPAYVLSARLGLQLAFEHPSATPVWPPTGIAIAALIYFGYRIWPLVFCGALIANLLTAGNVWSSIGIAAGNTLEGVAAAYLTHRFCNGTRVFDRPGTAATYIFLAGFLSTSISATIGVMSLATNGFLGWSELSAVWLTWWLGDATSALIVAPLILVWATHRTLKWDVARAIEGAAVLATLLVIGVAIFGRTIESGYLPYAQGFLVFPPLVWIAFRFYPRMSTTATLMIAAIVLVGTLTGSGPFAVYDRNTELLVAQAFTGVAAVTALLLSSATYERMLSEQAIRESEDRFRAFADSSPSMIWVADPVGSWTFTNRTWLDFTGREESEEAGLGWMDNVHPDDLDSFVRTYRTSYSSRKGFRVDLRLRRSDGQYRWVMVTGNPRVLSDGTFAGYVGSCIDISERKQYEKELQQEALRDPLTGLPNRALFLDRLDQCLNTFRRDPSKRFAVLFLDIDRLKLINDSLGHAAGDRLLADTSERIRTILRPGDTVARLGGDEFAVLLPGISELRHAEGVATGIENLFGEPFIFEGAEFYAGASIGVTLVQGNHATPNDILQDADGAMYRAKVRGKRREVTARAEPHTPVVESLRLEAELSRSVEAGSIDVHFQPIFSLSTGAVSGFEALARWMHPRRGTVPPSQFIPVAEKGGLIAEIDAYVLRRACKMMSRWLAAYPELRPMTVNVNVSVRLFSQIDVVKTVSDALRASGLEPSSLELEITESVFMENRDLVAGALRELRSMGVKVALDDFGTGYSSLALLNHFLIDSLKIDRSFIADLNTNGSGAKVAKAIVDLAHDLHLRVTAEGVETSEELAAVKRLKCDHAQGHTLSKPLTATDAEALLKNSSSRPNGSSVRQTDSSGNSQRFTQ